jgi:hypothetical protein
MELDMDRPKYMDILVSAMHSCKENPDSLTSLLLLQQKVLDREETVVTLELDDLAEVTKHIFHLNPPS